MVESSDLSPDDVKSAKLVEASNATEKAPSPSISSRPIDVDREGSEAGQGGLVDFGDETDLSNPQNWSPKLKWSLIVLVSLLDFAVSLATIICAPVAPQILAEFSETNDFYITFIVSVWELGEIFGPLIVAPLSELYGRLYIYHAGNILSIIFSAACALSTNIQMLVAFRFLNGLAVVSTALNPSIVGDLFRVEQRGSAMSIVGLATMLGPVVGPIIGGYLGGAVGWRWCFWLITILCGFLEIGFLLLLRETYSVQILKGKAQRLRKETNNPNIRSKYETEHTALQLLQNACVRPLLLLFTSPILFLMSLYVAVVYGYLYLVMTTITSVFESVYNFSSTVVGLSFLGLGIGCVIGVFFCRATLDLWVRRQAKSGQVQPEQRLPPVIFGGFILPVGLFMYGWTAEVHTHFLAPIIATGILGMGLVSTTIPVRSYLVDAFGIYAASAIAGCAVLRNLGGTFVPLAGPPLYQKLGLGWGNSVLGFIALAFIPVPLLLMRYGQALRSRDKRKFAA
ncbi:MFS multidrug transporter [Daldinia loculata]|uniref:MFS multidrug transporter n=1 Tax=Daldinia loculata TaxID=103429 RepID=UPI0020C4CA7D|nr:MFS multidrug transporter [Daldinia loculata]KAI1649923.1 MFS multidrug transporter [Daldinia loculata]